MIQTAISGIWGGVLIPEPTGWWDFSDESTVTTVSGGVSSIADKSGNGYTISQSNASARPSYGGVFINGLKAARFDGSFDFMDGSFASIDTGNGITMAGVFRASNNVFSGIRRAAMMYRSNTDSTGIAFTNTRALFYERRPTSGTGGANLPLTVTNASAIIVRAAPLKSIRTNADGISTGSLDSTSVINAITLGQSPLFPSIANYPGDIGEILIWNSVFTDAQMNQKIGELVSKWRI